MQPLLEYQQQKVDICFPLNSHSGHFSFPCILFNIISASCLCIERMHPAHYIRQIQVLGSKNNCAHHWFTCGSSEAEDSEVTILGGRMNSQSSDDTKKFSPPHLFRVISIYREGKCISNTLTHLWIFQIFLLILGMMHHQHSNKLIESIEAAVVMNKNPEFPKTFLCQCSPFQFWMLHVVDNEGDIRCTKKTKYHQQSNLIHN